jgi:putative drug exporter of the RND superfamily
MLAAVARFSTRHRWAVLATWVVILAGTVVASRAWGGSFNNDLTLSGTDSQAAYDTLRTQSRTCRATACRWSSTPKTA